MDNSNKNNKDEKGESKNKDKTEPEKNKKSNILEYLGIGLIIGSGAVLTTSVFFWFYGFGTLGIVASSKAAATQSFIGNVTAGSLFSTLTSLGMKGVFAKGAIVGAAGTASGVGLVASQIESHTDKPSIKDLQLNFDKMKIILSFNQYFKIKPFNLGYKSNFLKLLTSKNVDWINHYADIKNKNENLENWIYNNNSHLNCEEIKNHSQSIYTTKLSDRIPIVKNKLEVFKIKLNNLENNAK